MNILYLNHYAGSLSLGMELRPYYLSREWKKRGHNVRIVTSSFSHLRSTNPKIEKDLEIKKIDGVEFQFIKTCSYKQNGIKRALTMFVFCGKCFLYAKKIASNFKPDVVISSSTYPLDTFSAQKISNIAKCNYIHESHDIWPLTLIKLGGMSPVNPFVLLMGIAERSAYANSKKVISVLPNSVEHMLSHGLKKKENFCYIPNGIDVEDWKKIKRTKSIHDQYLHELKKNGIVIGYVGGITEFDTLDMFVDAAKYFNSNRKIEFVIIGKGMYKATLERRKKDENINNLHILSSIPKSDVPSILSLFDGLYVNLKNNELYKYGISVNKVYDYMMAGVPIIYGIKAYNNEVEEAKCGIVFDGTDLNSLCDSLNKFLNMSKTQNRELGKNGKKWVIKNRNYMKLSNDFIEAIEGGIV